MIIDNTDRLKLTIITPTRNDCWLLSKTMRSVHLQTYQDVEHLIQDSNSSDPTMSLAKFWAKATTKELKIFRENDNSVYDGMNKGILKASGDYVAFLNSGDIFPSYQTLEGIAAEICRLDYPDVLIGCGRVNNRYWVPSCIDETLAFSSNGFCHQALWIKRSVLASHLFKADRGLVDSDRVQLCEILRNGYTLAMTNEVIAERSENIGISASSWGRDIDINLKEFENIRHKAAEWGISAKEAEDIVNFHRYCHPELAERVIRLMHNQSLATAGRKSIAISSLEALFRPSSKKLKPLALNSVINEASNELLALGEADSMRKFINAKRLHDQLSSQEALMISCLKDREAYLERDIDSTSAMTIPNSFVKEPQKPTVVPVVSLTSFPKRISTLHLVIESIVRQTLRPCRVFLSLGTDEFQSIDMLPTNVIAAIKKYDVEVRFANQTTNQYDKYLHLPREVRDKYHICIVDDDTIYHPDTILSLSSNLETEFPCIVANRVHLMRTNEDGSVADYKYWKREFYSNRIFHLLCPTGVGGVMYPPGFFTGSTCDQNAILATAPYADDLWLKYISKVNNIPVKCSSFPDTKKKDKATNNWLISHIPSMSETSLFATNDLLGLNSLQISQLDSYFGKPFKDAT